MQDIASVHIVCPVATAIVCLTDAGSRDSWALVSISPQVVVSLHSRAVAALIGDVTSGHDTEHRPSATGTFGKGSSSHTGDLGTYLGFKSAQQSVYAVQSFSGLSVCPWGPEPYSMKLHESSSVPVKVSAYCMDWLIKLTIANTTWSV